MVERWWMRSDVGLMVWHRESEGVLAVCGFDPDTGSQSEFTPEPPVNDLRCSKCVEGDKQ